MYLLHTIFIVKNTIFKDNHSQTQGTSNSRKQQNLIVNKKSTNTYGLHRNVTDTKEKTHSH